MLKPKMSSQSTTPVYVQSSDIPLVTDIMITKIINCKHICDKNTVKIKLCII